MKNLLLLLLIIFLNSCSKERQMIVFVSHAKALDFELQPVYRIQPQWANFDIEVKIAHLNSNLKFEDAVKIAKIEFPTDSTYLFSTWTVEKKQMKLLGQAGAFQKNKIHTEEQFKTELGQIYGTAWVE